MMPDYFWPLVSGIIALGVLFAGVLPRIKTERAKGVIDLQAAEIDAYQDALSAQEARFNEKLAAMESRHQSEMGQLRGRVDSMTPEFAATLAKLLLPLLKDAV